MKNFMQILPTIVIYVLLTIIYLACGYVVGHHDGYKNAEKEYSKILNKI